MKVENYSSFLDFRFTIFFAFLYTYISALHNLLELITLDPKHWSRLPLTPVAGFHNAGTTLQPQVKYPTDKKYSLELKFVNFDSYLLAKIKICAKFDASRAFNRVGVVSSITSF